MQVKRFSWSRSWHLVALPAFHPDRSPCLFVHAHSLAAGHFRQGVSFALASSCSCNGVQMATSSCSVKYLALAFYVANSSSCCQPWQKAKKPLKRQSTVYYLTISHNRKALRLCCTLALHTTKCVAYFSAPAQEFQAYKPKFTQLF